MSELRDTRLTRRALLGAGVTALTATAGCSSLSPLGARVKFGRIDLPAGGEPTYRRWLPAPEAAAKAGALTSHDPGDGGYPVFYGQPEQLADASSETSGFARKLFVGSLDYFGHGFDSFEHALMIGLGTASTTVLEGDTDRSALEQTLKHSGYRAAGSHRGYTLFERSDIRRVVAIGEGTVLFSHGATAMTNVQILADTAAGSVSRWYETSEDMATLIDSVGSYPWVSLNFGVMSNRLFDRDSSLSSTAFVYEKNTVHPVFTGVYDDENAVDRTKIKQELRKWTRNVGIDGPGKRLFGPETQGADISIDGRVVRVESKVQKESLGRKQTPQITWRFEESGDSVTVRHEAGTRADASVLGLRWKPPENSDTEPDRPVQFSQHYDRVGPGDAVTVDTSGLAGMKLGLVYQVGDGESVYGWYEVNDR